ncbi:unnamed protein product [Victoria cruziana]
MAAAPLRTAVLLSPPSGLSTSPYSYAFLKLNTALQRRSWQNAMMPRIRMVHAESRFSGTGPEHSGHIIPEVSAGSFADAPKAERRRVVVKAQSLEGESLRRRAVSKVPERVKVVAMVAFVMLLCNANRIVMSVAVVPLAAKYGWSSSFLGIVQSSFLWGYFFSSIAGGAMADLYGGKRVMAVGAAIWSLASFLTPWAANHSTAMLLAVRVLFGLAEGVAIPCMNKLLSGWFPSNERASAVGISMGGFHMGNLVGLLATPPLMALLGITGPFALWGALGYMWLSFWVPGASSDPRDSPRIDPLELELIQAGKDTSVNRTKELPDLRLLFSKLPTWAIVFANITNHWGYFVLLSWMPVYFKTVFDVNLKQAAWFSAIPWGMMALSGYVAGWFSDTLQSRYPVTQVRKIMQSIGFVGPGVSLLCLNQAKSPAAAAIWLTIGLSLSSFSQAGFMLNMQVYALCFLLHFTALCFFPECP